MYPGTADLPDGPKGLSSSTLGSQFRRHKDVALCPGWAGCDSREGTWEGRAGVRAAGVLTTLQPQVPAGEWIAGRMDWCSVGRGTPKNREGSVVGSGRDRPVPRPCCF